MRRVAEGALAAAAVLAVTGFVATPAAPRTAPPPSAGVSSAGAVDPLRTERYARWVLARVPDDLAQLTAARRACREAVAWLARRPPADPDLAVRLKALGVAVEEAWRGGIRRSWAAFRRHRALREWRRARAALADIVAATNDPTDPDYRMAKRLLEGSAAR